MAPAYVKPFVKRQKNDAADAEAVCEIKLKLICNHQCERPNTRYHYGGRQNGFGAVVNATMTFLLNLLYV
jgi:hypothetical protein